MATALAAQLAQIAANSKSSLNVKAQKAAHSKSLIFEPRVAAGQSLQTIYTTCFEGFEELCHLDSRFSLFSTTLFSEQSQDEDRTQMTAEENVELDRRIESFLRLVGGCLRLMPAVKCVEWLIRRFRYDLNLSTARPSRWPFLANNCQNPRVQYPGSAHDISSIPQSPSIPHAYVHPPAEDTT